MKYKTQDTKFYIENNRLVGQSGIVPEDEPLFILRARDVHAIGALESYLAQLSDVEISHHKAVERRIADFTRFTKEHPERMKVPDTSLSSLHDGKP